MIALLCPGQGSQTPGMLSPWLELDSFARSIDTASAAAGIDLRALGTVADAETIRDTAVAQPLIVATGLACFSALASELTNSNPTDAPDAAALGFGAVSGHSVGEITAAAVAGVLDSESAMRLVAKRGKEMAAAAGLVQTGMAAILGGDREEILSALAELRLEPANFNGSGQIVAAGRAEDVAALQANPPAGTRVVPLAVAGAFHTSFMSPAVAPLADFVASLSPANPTLPIFSNAGGARLANGQEFLRLLVNQVQSPVRWDDCMAALSEAGVTAVIEVAPAGTLTGLAKRAMPGVELLAIKSPADIAAAAELIAKHRAA